MFNRGCARPDSVRSVRGLGGGGFRIDDAIPAVPVLPLAELDADERVVELGAERSGGAGVDLVHRPLESDPPDRGDDRRGARSECFAKRPVPAPPDDLVDPDPSLLHLDAADLTTATLLGVDLSCSRPWKAMLFPEPESQSDPCATPPRRQVNSVAELLEHCNALGAGVPSDRQFYFRGEAKNTWPLRPAVMRFRNGRARHRAHEGEMLLELMSRRPEDFASASTALDQWVLAQHHGLPTRLLDITRNPLVALLGASGGLDAAPDKSARDGRVHVFSVPRELIKPFTSDTVAIISNLAKLPRPEQDTLLGWTMADIAHRSPGAAFNPLHEHASRRLFHLIRQERPHFMDAIDPRHLFQVFVVEPVQSFERIRAQSGAFLISAFHERFERSEVLAWNDRIPVYGHAILDVPDASKASIVRELGLLNVTRETLLPGLDEAARAITGQYSGPPPAGP